MEMKKMSENNLNLEAENKKLRNRLSEKSRYEGLDPAFQAL